MRCFAGIRTKIYPRAGRDFANLNICVYIIYIFIYIYIISSIYFIYHIYFLYLYMYRTVSKIKESCSIYIYICSTMLEGLQKELQ